jgi:hypothetical protein
MWSNDVSLLNIDTISKLAKTTPFSIARAIVIVIIIAVSIATMIIEAQLKSLIESYTNSFN